MEEYIANGGRLGWLIDPFRRQAHIYRPGAEPVTLDDPEQLTGDPELPGFVFNVRALIFDASKRPRYSCGMITPIQRIAATAFTGPLNSPSQPPCENPVRRRSGPRKSQGGW